MRATLTTNPEIMNQVKKIETHKTENGRYTSYGVTVTNFGKETWVITVCEVSSGSYVMVRKASNNPFGGPGKEYESLVEAAMHYNSKSLKSAIREIIQLEQENTYKTHDFV